VEVEYAFLADAAQATDGKLHVLGAGIDEIRAPDFPCVHPYMSLVVKLELHPSECDRDHGLEIELWDPDGNRIGPQLKGVFSASRDSDHPTRSVFVQMVLNIMGAEFPDPADYAFQVIVNGQHMKEVRLRLVRHKAPAGGPEKAEPESKPPQDATT